MRQVVNPARTTVALFGQSSIPPPPKAPAPILPSLPHDPVRPLISQRHPNPLHHGPRKRPVARVHPPLRHDPLGQFVGVQRLASPAKVVQDGAAHGPVLGWRLGPAILRADRAERIVWVQLMNDRVQAGQVRVHLLNASVQRVHLAGQFGAAVYEEGDGGSVHGGYSDYREHIIHQRTSLVSTILGVVAT